MKEKGSKRRSFLKNAALLSWTLPVSITNDALSVFGEEKILKHEASNEQTNNSFTILITSDIHAQLHTHDEFFWENEKAIYKKRGGLAVLKTMINSFRAKNPNIILYDGGDFFHGHGVASLSEGEAFIPLINEFNYDLKHPENWE